MVLGMNPDMIPPFCCVPMGTIDSSKIPFLDDIHVAFCSECCTNNELVAFVTTRYGTMRISYWAMRHPRNKRRVSLTAVAIDRDGKAARWMACGGAGLGPAPATCVFDSGGQMNTEHLKEYIELARQLNFTATAKAMHITQPALSNHIRQLERETGVLLVERSLGTGARLTPAGQRFLESARRIVEEIDTTLPRLAEIQRETSGKIVIRTPRNEYSTPMLGYVFEFRRLHPNIDVVMSPWVDTDGIEDVASGAVDCAYVGYSRTLARKDADSPSPLREMANVPSGVSAACVSGTPGCRSCVDLVTYADVEIVLWVDRDSEFAGYPVSAQALDGHEVVIPANQKRDSWALGIESVADRLGIRLPVNERYCDSLEDLLLDKVGRDDVLVCDANLLKSSAFSLRPDRVAVRFDPPLVMPISLACAVRHDEGSGLALRMLVEFLRDRYEGSPSEHGARRCAGE
jgi:DNA-binding transcriptional LysR family regulator